LSFPPFFFFFFFLSFSFRSVEKHSKNISQLMRLVLPVHQLKHHGQLGDLPAKFNDLR
jgi:hypothetical protein